MSFRNCDRSEFFMVVEPMHNKADIYVSDRRWGKCLRLMKACAFLNGRTGVDLSDTAILPDCLWSKLEAYALCPTGGIN